MPILKYLGVQGRIFCILGVYNYHPSRKISIYFREGRPRQDIAPRGCPSQPANVIHHYALQDLGILQWILGKLTPLARGTVLCSSNHWMIVVGLALSANDAALLDRMEECRVLCVCVGPPRGFGFLVMSCAFLCELFCVCSVYGTCAFLARH